MYTHNLSETFKASNEQIVEAGKIAAFALEMACRDLKASGCSSDRDVTLRVLEGSLNDISSSDDFDSVSIDNKVRISLEAIKSLRAYIITAETSHGVHSLDDKNLFKWMKGVLEKVDTCLSSEDQVSAVEILADFSTQTPADPSLHGPE